MLGLLFYVIIYYTFLKFLKCLQTLEICFFSLITLVQVFSVIVIGEFGHVAKNDCWSRRSREVIHPNSDAISKSLQAHCSNHFELCWSILWEEVENGLRPHIGKCIGICWLWLHYIHKKLSAQFYQFLKSSIANFFEHAESYWYHLSTKAPKYEITYLWLLRV